MGLQRTVVILLILAEVKPVEPFPEDIYKSEYKWIERGDINIGAILSIHSANPLLNCTSDIQDIRNVQNVEALSFAVQEINNRRSDLLPNLKLGFAILDDCLSPSIALARAIQFMPSSVRLRDVCDSTSDTCMVHGDKNNGTDFYDVVGVIGTYTSKLSIVVADVLNLFKIPQISHTATSNILSDKTRFPYFFRMVPPDRYQVMVMVSLLRYFNWTHVSIVYSEGSYGREGVKELDNILHRKGSNICIEEKIELAYNSHDSDFDRTLQTLNNTPGTRVVIAFVEIQDAGLLSKAIKRLDMKERFIWIGSDSVSLLLEETPDLCQYLSGSIAVEPYSRNIERFKTHMAYTKTEKGRRENRNPWLKEVSVRKSGNQRLSNFTQRLSNAWPPTSDEEEFIKSSFVDTFLIDSVYAFAYALDNVVKKHCRDWQRRANEDLPSCVSRVGIYSELKTLNFNGSLGKLKFNENGDIMTKYTIHQCSSNTKPNRGLRQIGFWGMSNETLDIRNSFLSWPGKTLPESSCPQPCTDKVGTIYYFAKQTCCWECVTCKPNEIVTTNATRCEVCRELMWPDRNRMKCENITPFHFGTTNAISVGLCTAAVSGIIVCIWICGLLVKYRYEHVVKCTSIELSAMIIIGAMLTFALTGSFLTRPTISKCYINQVGFSLVFTIIYAPLLVKTNRIYRIFNAGRRTTRKPCFISKSSQVLISTLLIFLQVAIVIITTSLEPPELRLQMASRTEKLVELFCYFPQAGLLSSLSFNLVLVLVCTFYAFKTRKLPDNYKESRYIAYCVDTTLLIWITFLPTYFTTSRAAAKLTILAASLLLNASVTVACLFIPRVYSLYKSLKNPCSKSGHHYNDFRIVKHVVKRKRSLVQIESEENQPRKTSSAVTIARDFGVKEYNDVITLTSVAANEMSSTITLENMETR